MLNKQKLTSGFQESAKQARQSYESLSQSVDQLKTGIGKGTTHAEFQQQALEARDSALGDIREQTLDNYGQAIADYLNGMVDPTQDGPLKPFTKGQCRPIIEALEQPDPNVLAVPPVDARMKAAWASLFPIQFKLNTPPPGSIREVSAVAPPVPIGSVAPVINGTKSHDDMINRLATVIDTAARQITVTIQHVISTPSGPAPGPPITGPVQ